MTTNIDHDQLFDRERSKILTTFIDTYLELSAKENRKLFAEIEKLPESERRGTMELTTSWYREGLQEGLQQGLRQGLRQGLQQGLRQGLQRAQEAEQRERELVLR